MVGYGVSDLARLLDVSPRDISILLYERRLPDDLCPIVSGRRVIPEEVIPRIRELRAERGKLPAESVA